MPTDEPESDGTLSWDSTTIVVVEVHAGGATGLGYAYGDVAVATFVESKLSDVVEGRDALSPARRLGGDAGGDPQRRPARRRRDGGLRRRHRALGPEGEAARRLPRRRPAALPRRACPVYGSGGFTSYSPQRLRDQLEGWMEAGLPRVKVKVGREPERDPDRLALCRKAIGGEVELMVDANGAFEPKQALREAERYADYRVSYLEEPVSSEDRAGLRLRARARARRDGGRRRRVRVGPAAARRARCDASTSSRRT